ncbi:MAG: helix-turn-helix transcriptional regulator [Alphaproteobacteria bacterium]|nr:helix-turn-helix transcriptional regulator [Alphaproteobacteria bacterium]
MSGGPGEPEKPPAAFFWLGDSKLRVVAADALEPDMAAIGAFELSGRQFVILKSDRHAQRRNNAVDLLTKRELQIAFLVAAGKVNKQIAHRLGISAYTVSSYLKRIFLKLNCRTRAEMAALVIETLGSVGDLECLEDS